MINLLPPDLKADYRYARRNRNLRRWISWCLLALLGAAVLTAAGYMYLQQSNHNLNQQIASSTKQLQSENVAGVQKQVTAISNNLKLLVQVLSKEVLFSELLKRLGSVTPSNVILTNLAISQTQGGIDITAQTADYNAATQLQVNLADPKNQIFSKTDIVSISCSSQTTDTTYPCTATLRALFAANNPFLFSNQKAATP